MVDHLSDVTPTDQHKEHVINAFVWPATQADSSVRQRTRRGFNMIEWNAEGMRYWVVSDVSLDDLEEFARLTRAPPPPAAARPN